MSTTEVASGQSFKTSILKNTSELHSAILNYDKGTFHACNCTTPHKKEIPDANTEGC